MFVRGEEYRRKQLHKKYGGQQEGGISTPKGQPFIFTGESGKRHGYDDPWEDGVLNYYGAGQIGDMQMLRGNRAIRDHQPMGRRSTSSKMSARDGYAMTVKRPASDMRKGRVGTKMKTCDRRSSFSWRWARQPPAQNKAQTFGPKRGRQGLHSGR